MARQDAPLREILLQKSAEAIAQPNSAVWRDVVDATVLMAGVIGGNAFVTEPGMAATVGSVIFVVVVVGGLGSLAGAFLASLLIGILQTFAVAMDGSVMSAVKMLGMMVTPETFGYAVLKLKISQVAPILPYLLLVLMLIFRPKGLLGTREG